MNFRPLFLMSTWGSLTCQEEGYLVNEGCLVMMLDIFRAHYSVLLASITRLEFIMERLALAGPHLDTWHNFADSHGQRRWHHKTPSVWEIRRRHGGAHQTHKFYGSTFDSWMFFFYKQFLETCLRDCDLRVDQSRDKWILMVGGALGAVRGRGCSVAESQWLSANMEYAALIQWDSEASEEAKSSSMTALRFNKGRLGFITIRMWEWVWVG